MSARTASESVRKALVAAFGSEPALASFKISDRPARPSELPHLRIGPSEEEPWSTDNSGGGQVHLTVSLTDRSGSFAGLVQAADAVGALLDTPLSLDHGTSVIQRLIATRFHHEPQNRLERATLTIKVLVDLGADA